MQNQTISLKTSPRSHKRKPPLTLAAKKKAELSADGFNKSGLKIRRCNLCSHDFSPRTIFDRYCTSCKTQSEVLRYSEWLPEFDGGVGERLPA
jgi:hypothetical protein